MDRVHVRYVLARRRGNVLFNRDGLDLLVEPHVFVSYFSQTRVRIRVDINHNKFEVQSSDFLLCTYRPNCLKSDASL